MVRWLFAVASFQAGGALLPPTITPMGGLVHTPILVRFTNVNSSGALFFTVDGGDPRTHFGHVAANARCYTEPLSINCSSVIRARTRSGNEWSDLVAAAFTADQDFSKLLFTEIMYHPKALGPARFEFEEFVELKNVGTSPLDVSGLELRDMVEFMPTETAPRFRIPQGTIIQPGGFYVLARNSNTFTALYPGVRVHGEFAAGFSNHEGTPALRRPDGATAAMMAYRSHAPWPVVPDNHGYFLVSATEEEVGFSQVRATLAPEADPVDPLTWRASAQRGGSPGRDDPPNPVPPIYINELLTRTSSGLVDSVELFNPNPTPVHVGGWWLSDARNWPYRYKIPAGTTVPSFGFVVFDESQFNAGTNAFSFSADGERCYLFSGDENGTLTGYSHGLRFAGSERDVSFGRHRSSVGTDYFLPEAERTFGATNRGARQPPLLITELMYRAAGSNVEYVELRNTLQTTLALWDPQRPANVWGIGHQSPGEAFVPTFLFPATTVAPGGYVVLAGGDLEQFRARHNVPADVLLVRLPNHIRWTQPQGTLLLYSPSGLADWGGPRYVIADQINYSSVPPWHAAAASGESSLERIGFTPFGDDPASWRASPTGGSPGRDNSTNLPPAVWAGSTQIAFVDHPMRIAGEVWDDFWPATAVTSHWERLSGPAAVAIEQTTLASATATFPQQGQYVLRLTASDGVFTNSDTIVVDVMVRPFDLWRRTTFNAAEQSNDNISGPHADPDGDGLVNTVEYLFGTAPKNLDPGPLRTRVVNGYLEVSWNQRADAPDIRVLPERADRLEGPWFGGPGLFEISETSLGGNSRRLALRSRLPASTAGQQFVRVRVELIGG